ncbi:MAG TPA: carbon starvation protein A [Vicinamibacterales bacterium]|jgi:carbon starvation protein|nr:carbon starvation protein A [Vicinamibacterales bacterium]
MQALYIVIPVVAIFMIAYRYYSAFIAAKVMALDDARVTPAHTKYDGSNFHPMSRWVLFGHHFAAIAGAGPLVGPVLAAQFGFAPGLLWLVGGCTLAGAVHDSMSLWMSTRRGGRSLADIARAEIGTVAGTVGALSILFILIVALAGLGIAVVNALAESAWSTFTIGVTIPIGMLMGFHMFVFRKGKIREATIIGILLLIGAVIFGRTFADSSLGHYLVLTRHQVTAAMAIYALAASILPMWMLLTPRGYLSTFMKIGTIAFLAVGVIVVNPTLHAPAFSQFIHGGGPVIPGPLYPFVFITIACGAISGFHSLIATGTTPKMVDKESDIRPIGYAGMLCEGFVGVMALIAATALYPGDYFAINTSSTVFANLHIPMVNLAALQAAVGENVTARPGGAVSLAVGMAQIFSSLPGMRGLMAYWYHFAIMFEALFILTTVDSGTRVGRFLVQEFGGRVWKKLGDAEWLPGSIGATAFMVLSWGYFIWTGNINTIWPLFGIANQLLGAVALAVATTVLINMGRTKYAWVTFVPLAFLSVTTMTAGYMSIRDNFWPLAINANPDLHVQGYVLSLSTGLMMVCCLIIMAAATWRWVKVLTGRVPQLELAEA